MSNLESAKSAIESELSQAKQGLSFYQSRIDALEKTLLQLAGIDGESVGASTPTASVPAKRGRKPGSTKAAKPAKEAKKRKATKGEAGVSGLPFTGGDFWPNLVTSEPQSASDILNAAIARLGFTPTKEQLQKLAGRQTFAINALVKAGSIQDSGKGRERRYFKA